MPYAVRIYETGGPEWLRWEKVPVGQRYPVRAAAQAHSDLEARRTTGSTVLLP